MLDIEIDGKQVQVPAGGTIMDAAQLVGAYIPHFCYHKKLSISANCRMCLVQVEKAPKPLPACATPVTSGMKVFTHSEPVSYTHLDVYKRQGGGKPAVSAPIGLGMPSLGVPASVPAAGPGCG